MMENKKTAGISECLYLEAEAGVCPVILNTLKTSVICCRLDENLTFLWGNSSFFSLTGCAEASFRSLYRNLQQYFISYPNEFTTLQYTLAQAIQTKNTDFKLTVRLPLLAGGFSWIRICGTIKAEAAGGPIIQLEFTDSSELEAEKEELTRLHDQKQQYFQWMLEAYGGNVYISDIDTYELLYLNQTACNVLGVQACSATGRKCYEAVQGREAPCTFCNNDKLSTEYKLARKDQERDAIIRSVHGGFARVDARDRGTILWYGGAFLDLIGYTNEQFEQELHSQCTYVHPEDIEHVLDVMRQSSETGESTALEGRIITRDGTVKILTFSFSYVSSEDSWDGIPSFYSVGIDITGERAEQSRQRQALADACKTAQIANDAKTNFLSSMSHDIRTPMNAIIGMSVIAQANLHNTEKMVDCLEKIHTSSRHLLNLINEVLDMSKIESGKIDLALEEVSLSDVVEDVMSVFRPLVEEKHQELQINADHVHHERVVTDGSRLQQILVNLLSNAVKYTPEFGSIGLRIREVPSFANDRGQYEFIITDSVIGMSEEYIPHLFEPFSRAEDSIINGIQGTGLGMAITQNIVHMMNGTIEVMSILGEGSQFIVAVSFPICSEAESYDTELAGLPVLVVDDDQTVCESVSEILNELGMRSSWALTGREAISRVAAARDALDGFFAVILDWRMPEMDGLETLKAIRREQGTALPVIMISACDYSDMEDKFRLAGADTFITKPLFKSKLTHVLHKFCQNSQSGAHLSPYEKRLSSLVDKRILLVEDNELNCEIATELLQMNHFMVDTAENGRIAVEMFKTAAPRAYACILMDIQMPVMNGYQAAETIRALNREDARTVPILALTANAFASDIGKAHRAGMNDHVSKPIDIDQLMDALQRWIEVERADLTVSGSDRESF